MEQVDKTMNRLKLLLSFLVTIFFIFGCSSKSEYVSSSRSFDKNITKDELLHAAKRVFILTDKDAFIIDSYRDELNVTKPKAAYKFYTMDIQNDNFHFVVDSNITKPTIEASLSIYRTYGMEKQSKEYLKQNSYTYKLFWDRIEYLLGLQDSWTWCNPIASKGFICDVVDLDNSWLVKKERVDLNTTTHDINTTKETIDISSFYKKESSKNLQKEFHYDTKIIAEQSKKEDTNSTIRSFKIPKLEKVDINSTKGL